MASFGALLRRHRLAAGLTQAALAERARLSAIGISALERGFRQTPQRETLALLAGALALSDEQRQAFEKAVAGAAMPRRRGDTSVTLGPWPSSGAVILPRALTTFVGREAELTALDAALAQHGIVAVHGLGGVGKSSVAREYASRKRDRYSTIWWLNAQTEDGIIEGLIGPGAAFVTGLDQRADRRAAAKQVVNTLLTSFDKPVLLVFDSLEEERHLRAWLPRTRIRALITSRNAAWAAGIPAIQLEAWPLETATEYLRRESGRADLTAADARVIAEALGRLPLALAHAAGSLREMRMLAPERYLKHITAHLKNAPRGTEYPRSVFATFKTAISQVEHEAAGAAAALCFAASFAADAIPDELFRQPVENYAEGLQPIVSESAALDLRSLVADEVRLDAVLGALDRISLLAYSENSQTYGMHRLVRFAGRDLVSDASRAWGECAVRVVDAAFPEVEFAAWPQCARLVAHARAALDALPSNTAFLPAACLASRCAVYLFQRGEYSAAEALQKCALAIREEALGPDHLDVANTLNRLANVYGQQGRNGEAEALLVRAVAIHENAIGSDHLDVANTLNGLANIYGQQGRSSEAETLHKRVLMIREEALGPDHLDVASSLNNVANVYCLQGRDAEAEALHRRALTIIQKTLGPDHPQVAVSLSNLAVAYRDQGRYDDAEPLLARALLIKENTLGPNHPDVARSLNNLGEVHCDQGRYEEAEPLYTRALAIWENGHGPDHPEVADILNNLGEMQLARTHYAEAEQLYTRALAIRERTLGSDHPEVATSLSHLANLYAVEGRDKGAAQLYTRALTIREKTLGSSHPKTKAVRDKLEGLEK